MRFREIFGPILPLISVNDVDEAIEFINSRYVVCLLLLTEFQYGTPDREHALVVYVFSQNKTFQEKGEHYFSHTHLHHPLMPPRPHVVFSNTQSGTAVANDCVLIPGGTSSSFSVLVYLTNNIIVSGIPMGGVGASGCAYLRRCTLVLVLTRCCTQTDITLARTCSSSSRTSARTSTTRAGVCTLPASSHEFCR